MTTPFEILLGLLNSTDRTYTITGMRRKLSTDEINQLLDRQDLPSGLYIHEDWNEETDTTTITFL